MLHQPLLVQGLSPPDPSTSSGDRDASSTRAAAAASVPGAMGETHAAQLERLAQGGRRPAHERETLTDKVGLVRLCGPRSVISRELYVFVVMIAAGLLGSFCLQRCGLS
jgi:hypothetical protein